MKKGLVSVLIPCFNASKYLPECLEGLLLQTYKNIEIIIVNDGSTDDSEKIINKYIKKFKKNNQKLIKINQKNQGQASACSNGLKYVNGEYLYWQDADDVIEHDALEKMVSFLENNPNFNIVRGKATFRKEISFDTIERIAEPKHKENRTIFDDYIFEKDSYCFVGVFLVRMNHFDERNPKRELYVSSGGQNYQLLLPITYKSKCAYIDAFIYKYRIVENSHSHSIKTTKEIFSRWNEHKDILINTINSINEMSEFDKKIYNVRINIKYIKRKVKFLIRKILKILLIKIGIYKSFIIC